MTRFARAKGSKASNEKAPEDGTPWEVMKEQLMSAKKESEDAKKRQEAEQQRIENYENFLKERKTQKQPASWCDFPEANNNSKKNAKTLKKNKQRLENSLDSKNTSEINKVEQANGNVSETTKKQKKKNKQKLENSPLNFNKKVINHEMEGESNNSERPKKKKNKKRKAEKEPFSETTSNGNNKLNEDLGDCVEPSAKKKKKNKQQKQSANFQSQQMQESQRNFNEKVINQVMERESNNSEGSKKKKNKKRKTEKEPGSETTSNGNNKLNEDLGESLEPSAKKKKKNKHQKQSANFQSQQMQNEFTGAQVNPSKKKKNKEQKLGSAADSSPPDTAAAVSFTKQNKIVKTNQDENGLNQNDLNSNPDKQKTVVNKQNKIKAKKKKLVDGKPVRRKEIDDKSYQLIINGKEVELVRFDNFPVMKKDAERLADLKNSMIKKGIPKSEVQRTMKLERRRAEKALARVRREVCYNCRKGGHNLSDCPELKSKIPGADAAEGVCFKCGSTEHRQFECKVQRDKEFRFATCFICKEPGHIARQCPDNPKGLYPNGGSCKLCGDVTHLRKDCPTQNTKKEETSVKLQTLDSNEDLEDIGAQNMSAARQESAKKPKKIRF